MSSQEGDEEEGYINDGREITVKGGTNLQNLYKQSEVDKSDLPKYWDADYVRERIRDIKPGMHKVLYQLMWMTGVRVSEALSVRKKHIDFRQHTINIKWQKSKQYKTRNIACHPNLISILEIYTAGMNQEDRLFPITRQRAHQLYKRDFGGHPHQMRHSFAVNWMRNKKPLHLLSKHLGHKDIQYTMVYLQVVPSDIGRELLEVEF